MIATVLAAVLVALAAPGPPVQVRLAPIRCAGLPDADVRQALRVELRDRLLSDLGPAPQDFVLVSVSCGEGGVNLLAVDQANGPPTRRFVRDGAPVARPRQVALAIAELVQPNPAAPEVPPTPVVASSPPSPPVRRPSTSAFTLEAAPVLFGGYVSESPLWDVTGGVFRLGYESRWAAPGQPGWIWGAALQVEALAAQANENLLMNALLVTLAHAGRRVVPHLALGGRIGGVSDFGTAGAARFALAGGPMVSAGLQVPIGLIPLFDFAIDAGYDFGSHGAWFTPRLGFAVRY